MFMREEACGSWCETDRFLRDNSYYALFTHFSPCLLLRGKRGKKTSLGRKEHVTSETHFISGPVNKRKEVDSWREEDRKEFWFSSRIDDVSTGERCSHGFVLTVDVRGSGWSNECYMRKKAVTDARRQRIPFSWFSLWKWWTSKTSDTKMESLMCSTTGDAHVIQTLIFILFSDGRESDESRLTALTTDD